MVRGFHHLVRHLQEALQRLPAPPPEASRRAAPNDDAERRRER
jgi:hypothetical protein